MPPETVIWLPAASPSLWQQWTQTWFIRENEIHGCESGLGRPFLSLTCNVQTITADTPETIDSDGTLTLWGTPEIRGPSRDWDENMFFPGSFRAWFIHFDCKRHLQSVQVYWSLNIEQAPRRLGAEGSVVGLWCYWEVIGSRGCWLDWQSVNECAVDGLLGGRDCLDGLPYLGPRRNGAPQPLLPVTFNLLST